MARWLVPAVGVVIALLGLVWVGQGTGLIGGSAMTGSQLWLVNGLIAVAVGIGLLVVAARVRRP